MIKSRIKGHRKVRAGDLVPHEHNPRTHTDAQKGALLALYSEIGIARSLLAYELPDGRLKLIDGHLRTSLDPDQEYDVEVLDVTDEEARALLLSIDPLAQLAGYNDVTLDILRSTTTTASDALHNLWQTVNVAAASTGASLEKVKRKKPIPQQVAHEYVILVECRDDAQQRELLARFATEGLTCSAKNT